MKGEEEFMYRRIWKNLYSNQKLPFEWVMPVLVLGIGVFDVFDVDTSLRSFWFVLAFVLLVSFPFDFDDDAAAVALLLSDKFSSSDDDDSPDSVMNTKNQENKA